MIKFNKTIVKTIIYTLIVELLICIIIVGFFYYNYKTFATANSGVSEKTLIKNIDSDMIDIDLKSASENSGSLDLNLVNNKNFSYNGLFGNISEKITNTKTNSKYIETKEQTFELNQENIRKAIIINNLKSNNIIDKYTFTYLKILETEIFKSELNNLLNFQILQGNITSDELIQHKEKWENEIKLYMNDINSLINNGNYQILSSKLQSLENEYKNTSNLLESSLSNDNILNSVSIQYVLEKLLKDPDYSDSIDKVSSILGIEKNLLVSAISVEQVRYMTTARGYAKTMIMDNKYLTNFSQFSYGIGGIKVETARNILTDLEINNKSIYDEYFAQDKDLDDTDFIAILQDKFRGTLYAGALIYNIQKRWYDAGYSLNNQPGIVITLYNIGNPLNKIPNADPKMGGSLINIEDREIYFGELGFLVYNYLKYYVE